MAVDFLHYLAGITILDAEAALDQELRVIEQLDAPLNQQFFDVFQESHPEPTMSTVMAVKPELTFRTHVYDALRACGYQGLCPTADVPISSELWFKRAPALGTREARDAGNHRKFQCANFLLYWTTLRAPFQQPAMCDCRLKPVWDGTTAPFVSGGLGDIPFTPDAFNNVFTLGKIKWGSTVIDENVDLTINLNQQMAELGADDDIYDSTCVINSLRPEFMLTGYDLDRFTDFGEAGPASPAVLYVYLRRKKANGTYYANNTNNHIKITASYNHWVVDKLNGQMNNPATQGYRIRPVTNSVETPILTIEFDQQIP